jgi:hypothetical protein
MRGGRGCAFILDFLRGSRSWPDWLIHSVACDSAYSELSDSSSLLWTGL